MKIKIKFEPLLLIIVAIILFFLFLHKIDYTALSSYDEAWYADITRNLVSSGNPFSLVFNGAIFTDHPPFGFMLMAIPTIIFGSNEFSARLTSAVLGVGTILVIYLLGKKLNGKIVGISAALILLSSMWFVLRVRSGNLDISFLFFEVLTVYLLLNENKNTIYLATISFAALILTKTLVGFGLLPVAIYIIFFKRKKFNKNILLKAFILFLLCVLPWYIYNQSHNPGFLYHHFFEIGTRSLENNFTLKALSSGLKYLAIGIGKWYKIFLVSISFGLISYIFQKKQRFNIALLFLWLIGFSIFLISNKTEIWHLLPLYPVIALIIPLSLDLTANFLKYKQPYVRILILTAIFLLAAYQFNQFYNLMYFDKQVYSAERDISIKAKNYNSLHIMETFYPAAVYYSQKKIDPLYWNPNAYQIMIKQLSSTTDVFIINESFRSKLENDGISFDILDKNDSYYLISGRKQVSN